MAQTDSSSVDLGFLEKAVEGISDPIVLAAVVVLCVLIYRAPAIISVVAEARRLGRENTVEVDGRRKLLASQIKASEDKRLRKKRRQQE